MKHYKFADLEKNFTFQFNSKYRKLGNTLENEAGRESRGGASECEITLEKIEK